MGVVEMAEKSELWSDDELSAAVKAYLLMAEFEILKSPYSKRDIYVQLAQRFDRTEKAFEYRMQNISAVLHERGSSWVPGLKPAGNVGANIKLRIVALLNQLVKTQKIPTKKVASYKAKLPAMRDWLIAVAQHKGIVTYGQMMEVFDVDRFSLRHAMDFMGHQATNQHEPIITALIVNTKTRRCSAGLAKEFEVYDDEQERQRLYEFWSALEEESDKPLVIPPDLESRADRFVIVEVRPDQAAFRRRVYFACEGRCVISGCDVHTALDAAHRHGRSWRLGHNSASDGFLLRKDLHALYDSKLLWITDEGNVGLDLSVLEHYKQFDGVRLNEVEVLL